MSIKDILDALLKNKISMDDAERLLSMYKIEYIEDIARLDVNRELRRGVPEVIYAEGKEYDELVRIAKRGFDARGKVIVSRVRSEYIEQLAEELRDTDAKVTMSKRGRIVVAYRNHVNDGNGGVVGIITAGTSDIGVAEEARLVAEAMGCTTITAYDVGIAGIHRIFPILKDMISMDVDVLIVVAGMEGALPSIVTSLVDVPVIGVPTSIGYGVGAEGIGALISMLQSCTLGLAVVNIDNGVGAGALAAMIANRIAMYRVKAKELKSV